MARQQPVDEAEVQRALADLEQRVRQRRRLMGDGAAGDIKHDAWRDVTDNWHVSAHLPVTWSVPVVGRAVALAKRATRLLLRWYINPIVDQQNDFNGAVARAFVHVTAQQDALGKALEELERRVQALEERAAARVGEPAAPEGRAEQ